MTLAGVDELTDILAAPVFGGGLPDDVAHMLDNAASHYADSESALALLREARRRAPDHVAVLIALYRFFFYKVRLAEAREIAEACLLRAAIDNSLPLDWHAVHPGHARFASFDAPLARFFMFALKGYACLNMRLGDFAEARCAIEKLLDLDPTDKIGAQVLLAVMARRDFDDEG
jgi:tetratricopeptide (TPR) repeat protein